MKSRTQKKGEDSRCWSKYGCKRMSKIWRKVMRLTSAWGEDSPTEKMWGPMKAWEHRDWTKDCFKDVISWPQEKGNTLPCAFTKNFQPTKWFQISGSLLNLLQSQIQSRNCPRFLYFSKLPFCVAPRQLSKLHINELVDIQILWLHRRINELDVYWRSTWYSPR